MLINSKTKIVVHMKVQLKSATSVIKTKALPVVVMLCLFILPNIVFGQNPGDNPDNRPPEVPLDPRMTVLLIGMGILLAVKVLKKRMGSLKALPVIGK